MKTKASENVKLGLFVIGGLVFLILTLYMIGKNRNLFGATFTIKASMTTVNGLVKGNNVRFKGIDVGTVRDIELQEDGSIFVIMVIDKKMTRYIKQNAIASIGTDGLMGNKLVSIDSQEGPAPPVKEGSIIQSRKPIETDEMLRTLNTTNNTIERVTRNLDEITMKLNTSKSLWNLLSDTVITQDLKDGVKDFRSAAANTAAVTGNARDIVKRFGDGEGLAGTLFTDTTMTRRLDQSMDQIKLATDRTALMMENLEQVVRRMQEGEGTAGLLLSDTVLRSRLMHSAMNIEQGTSRFNDNMEALKSNFFFRRYFKKLEKQKAKEEKEALRNRKEQEALTKESKTQ